MTDQLELHLPPWVDRDRWRENQQSVFTEITDAFDAGNHLVVCNAPPGAGKSLLGYMTHRHINGLSYYLVGTKFLQSQIERTLPNVSVIKGRRNYIPTDIDPYIHGDDVTCDDCDKEGDDCSFCANVDQCTYTLSRDLAEMSSLTCANYSYALGEWTGFRSKFRDRDLVICDEADTLIDELKDFVSIAVPVWMQRRFNISPPAAKTVEESWPGWFEKTIPLLKKGRDKLPRSTIAQKRIASRVTKLIARMTQVAEDLDGWVYDYSTKRAPDEQSIEFKPVVADMIAQDALWRHGKNFLCMSASIGSPEQFVSELGWEDSWHPVFAESTFDVARRPIYFFPAARMSYKAEESETPKMAMGVKAALDMYPVARTLVLPHTYKISNTVHDLIAPTTNGRPLFIYRNADEREGVVSAFGEEDQSLAPVLFAPSLGRGYDNRDIDLVIICKVPFPYKGSRQIDKRSRMSDGAMWYANETAKTLIQNYGRVMRAEDDSGITLILDENFARFYGEWKTPYGHRLFPEYMCEAVDFDSDVRFELRRALKVMA